MNVRWKRVDQQFTKIAVGLNVTATFSGVFPQFIPGPAAYERDGNRLKSTIVGSLPCRLSIRCVSLRMRSHTYFSIAGKSRPISSG